VTELAFEVVEVLAQKHAVSPHLLFRLRITESSGAAVHAMALRCQLRIEPQRRPYTAEEQAALVDLFGAAERYDTTLKPFLWTHASTMIQGFEGSTIVDLPVPCTYDVEVAASKYFNAVASGGVPLKSSTSGTVFTRGETGFSVEQLSWSLEAQCVLPIETWRELMDHYFPGGAWLRLDRATLDALLRYRTTKGFLSWEQTVAALLPAEVGVS
jgi:hypothetical protein